MLLNENRIQIIVRLLVAGHVLIALIYFGFLLNILLGDHQIDIAQAILHVGTIVFSLVFAIGFYKRKASVLAFFLYTQVWIILSAGLSIIFILINFPEEIIGILTSHAKNWAQVVISVFYIWFFTRIKTREYFKWYEFKEGLRGAKKIGIYALVVFVSTAILAFQLLIYFPQIAIFGFTKYQFNPISDPELFTSLQDRVVGSALYNSNSSSIHSYLGINFQVPWGETLEVKQAGSSTTIQIVSLKFENDKVITITTPHNLDFREQFLNINPAARYPELNPVVGESSVGEILFGEKAISSEHEFYKLILSTTPNQVRILMPAREAVAKPILLILKRILLLGPAEDGLFSFETESIKGFQVGDPKTSKGVFFTLFDSEDNLHELVISNATQEEIDFILSSITFSN